MQGRLLLKEPAGTRQIMHHTLSGARLHIPAFGYACNPVVDSSTPCRSLLKHSVSFTPGFFVLTLLHLIILCAPAMSLRSRLLRQSDMFPVACRPPYEAAAQLRKKQATEAVSNGQD